MCHVSDPDHASAGGKKGAETSVQVIRPQNPRQHSEIGTGSHALTAQARSVPVRAPSLSL